MTGDRDACQRQQITAVVVLLREMQWRCGVRINLRGEGGGWGWGGARFVIHPSFRSSVCCLFVVVEILGSIF